MKRIILSLLLGGCLGMSTTPLAAQNISTEWSILDDRIFYMVSEMANVLDNYSNKDFPRASRNNEVADALGWEYLLEDDPTYGTHYIQGWAFPNRTTLDAWWEAETQDIYDETVTGENGTYWNYCAAWVIYDGHFGKIYLRGLEGMQVEGVFHLTSDVAPWGFRFGPYVFSTKAEVEQMINADINSYRSCLNPDFGLDTPLEAPASLDVSFAPSATQSGAYLMTVTAKAAGGTQLGYFDRNPLIAITADGQQVGFTATNFFNPNQEFSYPNWIGIVRGHAVWTVTLDEGVEGTQQLEVTLLSNGLNVVTPVEVTPAVRLNLQGPKQIVAGQWIEVKAQLLDPRFGYSPHDGEFEVLAVYYSLPGSGGEVTTDPASGEKGVINDGLFQFRFRVDGNIGLVLDMVVTATLIPQEGEPRVYEARKQFLVYQGPPASTGWQGAGSGGGFSTDVGTAISLPGPNGLVATAGSFEDQFFTDDGASMESAGDKDAYFEVLDPTGNPLRIQIGSPTEDEITSVVYDEGINGVDANTGYFLTGKTGSDVMLRASRADRAFFAKYDLQGELVWSKIAEGGQGEQKIMDLAINPFGELYAAGYFEDELLWRDDAGVEQWSAESVHQSDPNAFVLKLDNRGNLLWAQSWGDLADNNETARALALHPLGGLFVGGTMEGQLTIGEENLSITGNGIYLARLADDGTVLWAKAFQNFFGGWLRISGLAADAEGNVLMSGSFSGLTDFGGGEALRPSLAAFLVKFDEAGNFLWQFLPDSNLGDSEAMDVSVNSLGNAYLTGYFWQDLYVGDLSFDTENYYSDIFLFALDPDGEVLWGEQAGGPADDVGRALVADDLGQVYLTGSYKATFEMGEFSMEAVGEEDVFWAIYYGPSGVTPVDPGPVADEGPSLKAFPNPFGATLQLEVTTDRALEGHLELYNAQGQRLPFRQAVRMQPGTWSVSLNLNDLPAGWYHLRLVNSQGILNGIRLLKGE